MIRAETHAYWMRRALRWATRGRGMCAPNPAVGAVLVKDGRVLGEGWHHGPGSPHAEVEALKNIDTADSMGATLYVTLEPCCHYGRTPPCTDLIIQKKIDTVFYGFEDPNPIVAGRGVKHLHDAGVNCELLALPQIQQFYRSYVHWIRTKKPWVIAKIAQSLDAKIALPRGLPVHLTGRAFDRWVHWSRLKADAILTTAHTILADDPALNVRLWSKPISKTVVVLDRKLSILPTAQIFQTAKKLIVLHGREASLLLRDQLVAKGAECVAIPLIKTKFCLQSVFTWLGEKGMHDVWIEAGGALFSSLLVSKALNQAIVAIAAEHILGEEAIPSFVLKGEHVLDDFRLKWKKFGRNMVCFFE